MSTVERRTIESKRFKIDTTVNIAHILTTIGLVTAIFTWGADVKSMLVKHDAQIASLEAAGGRNDMYVQDQLRELKIDIRSLGAKIDYMLEYRPLPNYHGKK